MAGLIYDTGALIAADRNDVTMWELHNRQLLEQILPIVPSPVLAQAWRGDGAKHARLARLLRGCEEVAFTPEHARHAGRLLAKAKTSDVVDAAVVIAALASHAGIVTSDPQDIGHLLDAVNVPLTIYRI